MKPEIIKIFGSAGAGKTSRLISILEELIKTKQYTPEQIGYISYTKAAVNEVRERVFALGYTKEQVDNFRTLHSFCYRLLELQPNMVMQHKNYQIFGAKADIDFGAEYESKAEDLMEEEGITEGGKFKALYAYEKNKLEQHPQLNKFFSDKRYAGIVKSFDEFKKLHGMFDFNDFITETLKRKIIPQIKVLFIDEVQDATNSMFRLWRFWLTAGNIEKCYMAGDDLQAIYMFLGADAKLFIDHEGEDVCLDKTYRLPPLILDYSTKLFDRVKIKKDRKIISATQNGIGGLYNLNVTNLKRDPTNIINKLNTNDSTFVLFRHRKFCKNFMYRLMDSRIPFKNLHGLDPFSRYEFKALRGIHRLKTNSALSAEDLKSIVLFFPLPIAVKNAIDVLPNDTQINTAYLKTLGITTDIISWLITNPYEALQFNIDKTRQWVGAYLYNCLNQNPQYYEQEPNIIVSTIHGVKGKEANNVFLVNSLNINSYTTLEDDPDSEHKVFYVGATRAKKNLYLVSTDDDYTYNLS